MRQSIDFAKLKWGWIVLLIAAASVLVSASPCSAAFSRASRIAFQRSIIDQRHSLNGRYSKIPRKQTKYIIVHTSEAGLQSTLRTVASGKRMPGGYRTFGGHAHYVIARDGRTYRMMDKHIIADHAGTSMWNNETNISRVSVGIELVGYHYTPITDKQYVSAGILIDILKDIYGLNDRAVLTHSQIAWGGPNQWFRKNHRGRKKCAKNFERSKARLGPGWPYDPDTRAGRLLADPILASIFYSPKRDRTILLGSNVLDGVNTAWSIAGDDYNHPTTFYRLPDGVVIPGDQIEQRIGWTRLPKNTAVLLNEEKSAQMLMDSDPVKIITDGSTAWSFAGRAYNDRATQYFFPDGLLKNGSQIFDWDDLPIGTRLLVGYTGPFEVLPDEPPLKIVGKRYNHQNTFYYFPDKTLKSGNRVEDFNRIPSGACIFLPK